MPHMANLPWFESYCFVLMTLVILMSILFFSFPALNPSKSPTMKMLQKNFWKW